METVNTHEAKTHLSRLLERAAKGEEIIIAKAGKPIAMLVAFRADEMVRRGGQWAGLVHVRDDFDDPLPEAIAGPFTMPS